MELALFRRHTGAVTCLAVATLPNAGLDLQLSKLPLARTAKSKKNSPAAGGDISTATTATNNQADSGPVILDQSTLIVSGSEDFRIVVTAAYQQHNQGSSNLFPALFSFVGHGTCVRCLHVEGAFIYSGADDGYVRCWSLAERCEVQVGGVPIHAYQTGGVRSISIHENNLFVAGRGCASMWDAVSGDLLHVFPITSPTALRAVLVPSTLMLWVLGSDGLVFIFDVVACDLLTVLSAYKSTVLKSLAPTQESHAVVMQVTLHNTQSGSSQQWSTSFETGRARSEFEFYPPEFRMLHNKVHEVRLDIRRIAEETRWQAFNERFFSALDKKLTGDAVERLVTFRQAEALIASSGKWHCWLQGRRNAHRFGIVAGVLEEIQQQKLRFNFFMSWLRFARDVRHRRGRLRLADQLVQDAQHTVQAVYVRRAAELQLASNQRAARHLQAADMAARNNRLRQSRIVHLWRRCTEERQLAKKHENMALLLERSVNAWRRSTVLKKWIAFAALERKRRRVAKASDIMLRETDRVQRLLTLAALNRGVQARRHETRRLALVFLLERANEDALRRTVFLRLLRSATVKKADRRVEESHRLADRIRELDSYLCDGAVPEEAELDEHIEKVSAEVADAEKQVQVLQKVVEQLQQAEERLTAQQRAPPPALTKQKENEPAKSAAATRRGSGVHVPPPKEPAQLSHEDTVTTMFLCNASVRRLVGVGFQLRAHWDTIDDTHGVASTRPTATLVKSMERARAGFLPFAKDSSMPFKAGGGRWDVDESLLMKANRVTLKKALNGVREVLATWDHIFNRWIDAAGPLQQRRQTDSEGGTQEAEEPESPQEQAQAKAAKSYEAAVLKIAHELLENTSLWCTALEREAQLEYCAQEKESVEVYGGASLPARLQRNASMGAVVRRVGGPSSPPQRTASTSAGASAPRPAAAAAPLPRTTSAAPSARVTTTHGASTPRRTSAASSGSVPFKSETEQKPQGPQPRQSSPPKPTARQPLAVRRTTTTTTAGGAQTPRSAQTKASPPKPTPTPAAAAPGTRRPSDTTTANKEAPTPSAPRKLVIKRVAAPGSTAASRPAASTPRLRQ